MVVLWVDQFQNVVPSSRMAKSCARLSAWQAKNGLDFSFYSRLLYQMPLCRAQPELKPRSALEERSRGYINIDKLQESKEM